VAAALQQRVDGQVQESEISASMVFIATALLERNACPARSILAHLTHRNQRRQCVADFPNQSKTSMRFGNDRRITGVRQAVQPTTQGDQK
jgi:hypothetical protein